MIRKKQSLIPLLITLILFLINLSITAQENNWFHKNNPQETGVMTALEYCYFVHSNGKGFPWIDGNSSYEELEEAAYIYNTYQIYYASGVLDKCMGDNFFDIAENWVEVRFILSNDSLYRFGEQNLLFIRENKNINYKLYFYRITIPNSWSEEAYLEKTEEDNIDSIYINIENVMMNNPKEGEVALISISLSSKYKPIDIPIITVDYHTKEGTAIENLDYEPISGTVSFRNTGDKVKILKVNILRDKNDDEEKETFSIKFSNPVNAILKKEDMDFSISD